MPSPEYQAHQNPEQPEKAMRGEALAYELESRMQVWRGLSEEEAAQQTVSMHANDPKAFEATSARLADYYEECQARSFVSADEFEHVWASSVATDPDQVVRGFQRWLVTGQKQSLRASFEQQMDVETAFTEENSAEYARFCTSRLVATGLPPETAAFTVTMLRATQTEEFVKQSTHFAVYRADLIARMMSDGDTLQQATDEWNEWVDTDPAEVGDNALNWISQQLNPTDQELVQPSS